MWWIRRERTFPRNKSGRKEGSGDETTLIGVYAQVAFHTTQFSLHMQCGSSQASLEDSIKLSFFLNGGTKPLHHEKDIDRFIVVLRFSEPPQFLNTLFWGNLSFHHKLQNELNLWHYDRFLHHLEQHHWWIEQLHFSDFGLVSSVFFIWLLFVSVFPSVSSINPTLHHLSNRHLIFVQWILFQNIAMVHPPRFSDLANSFF